MGTPYPPPHGAHQAARTHVGTPSLKGDPRGADTGQPSGQKAEAPACCPARTSTSQRPGSPTAQPPKGRSAARAPPLSPAGWEGGHAKHPLPAGRGLLPSPRCPGRPAQAALRLGRALVRAARSRSPPCRPPISASLVAEAPPAPNGKAPLPAQGEMRRGRRDSSAPPPPTAPSAGGASRSAAVPLALSGPGRGSGGSPAGAGPGMRTAASLPVKVSPGPSCRTGAVGGAEEGGGMRRGDLTPSLREDGHLG